MFGSFAIYQCSIHKRAVNKSDTYILAGVLRFTINVDCSAPAFSGYG